MNSKDTGFVIAICLLFISLFFFNHLVFLGQNLEAGSFEEYALGDYEVHKQKAMSYLGEECIREVGCANQPYLFHLLAAPFSIRDSGFFFFVMLFIGVVIPFTVFKVTGEKWSVFFYFTVSNFFWMARGTFTNITAIWFVLLFFVFKKHWQRGLLLLLSILTHGYGFYLAFLTCALIYFFETDWGKVFPSFIAGCDGFTGKAKEIVTTRVTEHTPLTSAKTSSAMNAGNLLSVFWLTAPLPFFLLGVWGFLKEKQFAMICLTGLAFIMLGWSWRFLLLIGLLCVVGVSFSFKHLSRKGKYALLAMALVMGIIQFYNFWWESAKALGLIC